jgi:hypothetical protein
MRSRSVLLLRGSCQVERIALILRTLTPVAHSYDIHVFADYGEAVPSPPADLIAACSVFVYQVRPFSSLPLFGEELIGRGRSIRLPFVSCDAFWPSELQCEHDPRYPELPWGRYPYGDQILGRLLRAKTDDEEVVDEYLKLDFAKLFRLDQGIEKWFRLLEKLEAEAAIKISGFVRQNWRTKRLFWDSVHPTNDFLARITGELAGMLGIGVSEQEIRTAAQQVEEDNFIMKPVHPSLIRYFGLTWVPGDDVYRHLDDPPATSREWYLRYVAYMRELYAMMREPLKTETASVRFWKQYADVPA